MKVLMTGFEPFGGEKINPSWEAVRQLTAPEGTELIKHYLPVSFREAPAQLETLIRQNHPDIVLCVGQAGGRSGISLERIAVNLMDARIPDNDGYQPVEETVFPEGETAYFSHLPLREMEAWLKAAGLPVQISNTAGLYVCNCVFYTAAFLAAREYPAMKAGFIHVPYLPEQSRGGSMPFLDLEEDRRALELLVKGLSSGRE